MMDIVQIKLVIAYFQIRDGCYHTLFSDCVCTIADTYSYLLFVIETRKTVKTN